MGAIAEEGHRSSAERLIVLTVVLSTMLAPLNSTMIAIALPGIMDEFDAGLASAGWLVTAYLIAMASLQPVAGKIGDRLGRRRIMLGGMALFGIASLAAAVAPNLWALVFFRLLQAAAGALVMPNGAALVRELVPEERRGRVFGLVGAAVALAAASGPPLGGVLVEAAGWRAIFYVNLVLVLPALLMGWRGLPPSRVTVGGTGFDVKGAIMLPVVLVGTAALLMSIGRGATLLVLAMGAPVVIAMATLFVWYEFRHPDPVVRPRLFLQRAFAAANAGIGLRNLSMYTLLLSVPLLLVGRNGFSSLETGLVLTALSAAMVIVTPFGGQLADRFGRRLPTTIGGAILTLGALPMALAGVDVSLPFLVAGLVVVGIGIGLSTPGLQTTAVESVVKQEAGVASGIFSTSRYLGSIVGSAILAGALGAGRDDVDGIGMVFMIVFVTALLSTFATLGLRARPEVYSGEQVEPGAETPQRPN